VSSASAALISKPPDGNGTALKSTIRDGGRQIVRPLQ
jgi:hypothetical protein